MQHHQIGKILAVAIRTGIGQPMREVEKASATANGGLENDNPVEPDRGITLLSSEQWSAVNQELAADLPWHTRRANLLVECPTLAHLIGETIQIGEVVVEVKGETDPCGVMERQHEGLKAALAPEMRGGVHARILENGTIHVGDELIVKVRSSTDDATASSRTSSTVREV